MRYIAITLPILLLAAPAAAQAPTAPAEAMQRLAFLHGTWRGEGVSTSRTGQRDTGQVLETATAKLGGTVLLLEGLGWTGTEGAADYQVVHNALGVLSYDAAKGAYALRAYRDGTFVDADITVGDREVVWGFAPPNGGRVRYTIRLDEQGRWHEVGDYSRDGTTWHRIFEMRLTRAST